MSKFSFNNCSKYAIIYETNKHMKRENKLRRLYSWFTKNAIIQNVTHFYAYKAINKKRFYNLSSHKICRY